jgi:hypothetical protein
MTIYVIPTQSFSLVHMQQHLLALTLCTLLLDDVWLHRVEVLHSFYICGSCKKMFDTGFVGMFMIYINVYVKWFLTTWCLCEVFLKSVGSEVIKRWNVCVCVCVCGAINLFSLINMESTQNLTYKDTKIQDTGLYCWVNIACHLDYCPFDTKCDIYLAPIVGVV